MTRDPIKDGRNWYSYCGNNPVSFFDADGLAKIVIVVGEGNFNEDIFPQRFLDLMNILKEYLQSQGHEVVVLLAPSPEKLAEALQDADGLVFIGHGYGGGMCSRQDVDRLAKNDKDFNITADWLKKVLKGRKLKWIVSYACSLFANADIAQKWAALADYVYGFDNIDSHVSDMIKNWKDWAKGKYIPKGELPRRWHPKSNNGKGGFGTPLVPNLFANP